MIDNKEVKIEIIKDNPKGMNFSPSPYWIVVTHLPTMTSIRLYSGNRNTSQTKLRDLALLYLELSVADTGGKCFNPECVNTL